MYPIPQKALDSIPALMRDLPRTPEGLPIPFVTKYEDIAGEKVPNFRAQDMERWEKCFSKNVCALCGNPQEATSYFIGAPKSLKTLEWYDPPMHRQCASYALRACPFLAMVGFMSSGEATGKPDRFILVGVKTGEWYHVTYNANNARSFRVKKKQFVRSIKECFLSDNVPVMEIQEPVPDPVEAAKPYSGFGVGFTEVVGVPGITQGPPPEKQPVSV